MEPNSEDLAAEAEKYWDIVGKRTGPESAAIGDIVMIDDFRFGSHRQRYAVVTEIMTNEKGQRQIKFRDATVAEVSLLTKAPLIIVASE